MTPQPDEQRLVEQAKLDSRAFVALYDRYVERVYRYCYRRTGTHHDAEDLTAHTFRRALEGLPGYRWTGAPFGAWLFRIASNAIVDRLRARQQLTSLDAAVADGRAIADQGPGVLEEFLAVEERKELWQAVDGLPLQQQQVLALRFGQGLSNRDTARIIGRSETATKQLIYRSLKALRSALTTAGEEGDA